jgi:epoxyqueuosine reductase
MIRGIDQLEDELAKNDQAIQPTAKSPIRFEIMRETAKRGRGGPPARMLPTVLGIRKSLKSLQDNPTQPKRQTDQGLLEELEAYVLQLGASSVGYTKVPRRWVFQNKAILYQNAIMLSMEMDKEGIDTAPSLACMTTVMEIYRDLGQIANQAADFLRQRGFSAHAGHPLMGMALYPPLAQTAGLGWMGLNGIIITPEHGPRARLAAVFTSIENLPFSTANDHQWVAGYCDICRRCIRECPPKALYDTPIDHEHGQITYVDNDLCFPYFSDYYGCSVCIRVCPFNNIAYGKLKEQFLKVKDREAIHGD